MNYLLSTEQRAHEFDVIARLVASAAVKILRPSSDAAKINAMCELLEQDARNTIPAR
jgi:hypothetical protein